MFLDDSALVGRERSSLREDGARDRDLADRMEERRVSQVTLLGLAESEPLAEGDRVRRHAPLVVFAVLVACFDRRGERADRGEVRVVELVVQLDAADLRGADP